MYFTQNHFKYPHLIYARECGLAIPIETRNTTCYILGYNQDVENITSWWFAVSITVPYMSCNSKFYNVVPCNRINHDDVNY